MWHWGGISQCDTDTNGCALPIGARGGRIPRELERTLQSDKCKKVETELLLMGVGVTSTCGVAPAANECGRQANVLTFNIYI